MLALFFSKEMRRAVRGILCEAFRRTTSAAATKSVQWREDRHFICTQVEISPTEASSGSEREDGEPSCLSRRIERLPRGVSVGSVFQGWMGEGLPVHRGDVFHAINRLRKRKLHKRALEVMGWVIRERPYRPRELDYSYLLEFTTKLHGVAQGEKLFSCIPAEFRNELLFNNLVIACLDKGLIRLSLEYMKKMRELGHPISHLAFNRLIILHSSPGRRKSVKKILLQMKADKVAPHVSTYNILMKIEANERNVDGLVKVLGDMRRVSVAPNEISYCILAMAHAVARLYSVAESYVEDVEKSMTGDNWSTLDVLIILYGYLGQANQVERTWSAVRKLQNVRAKSYMLMIEATGRICDIARAEELWAEMKSAKGLKLTDQFNSMISVYCRHGMIAKASKLYKEMKASGLNPNSITYRNLALGCLKADMVDEAFKTLDLETGVGTSRRVKMSTPWLETTLGMVEVFAEKGDVGNAEKLFEDLKRGSFTRYTFVYNTLMKAYVRAKIYQPNLLRRMILGGARPDSESYSLMKLVEQFQD
uniref:Pentatricopeptide repeat-containing protein n=1 Tax=Kalanchoe fedtschenkoi TaxID=63787 RepID=A0A7N0UL36_KALFE